ncbi:multidrug effflux MFS transporter [Acinetobacter towneri]|uniref:multidrug effflux MFS transporter n=1 Tax=Acinetobacter towneri TaxID=202956 RepID=UPI0025768BE1|nr:multidrug effflux MFS transporter [Acinetobacter towneri]MDM1486503.1 multidrug effflux MFS transporter [Acinetobacter towneri]
MTIAKTIPSSNGTPQPSSQQYSTAWILLLALLTSLGPLSIDMYLPALPVMANAFGVPTQMVANSLPAYFLGLALGQLIYGPLSDRIGRKPPLYFGLALFSVASVLCVFAQNEWSLIAARILQALGGCVGVVIARAAIRDRLDLQTSAQAFSSMMIVMTLAPIIAPTLGAWVLQWMNWQTIFAVLACVGVICLICVHFFFQETLAKQHRLNLNFQQVLTLYGSILKDSNFRMPMLAGCLTGGALFCYISGSSAVMMDQYGLSETAFAYLFGANAVGIMLFSTINKKISGKLGVLQRLKLGSTIQVTGALLLVIAGSLPQADLIWVMLGLFLAVSGIGFTGPNAMALAMAGQGARAGTASAVMGSVQFFCGLIGGVLLNFMLWSALLNMALLMLLFIGAGMLATFKIKPDLD